MGDDEFPGQPWWPKTDLLRTIREERRRLDDVLARVPRDRMEEPGVAGEWSVKDVLAHIAWGIRENVGFIRARALVGSELWQLSDDERNAIVFQRERGRPLEDVLDNYGRSFDAYMSALEGLSEEDLNDPTRIRDMITGWRPWRILFDPKHDDEHASDIEAWLRRTR